MNTFIRRSTLITAVILASAVNAAAQAPRRYRQFEPTSSPLQQTTMVQPVPELRMMLGGLGLGALGFFAGGFAGAVIAHDDGSEDDFAALTGFAAGMVIGETVMLPLGVHLANERQGNYALSLIAAAATTGLMLVAATDGEDDLELMLAVPLIHLVSSITIEKKTTRGQASESMRGRSKQLNAPRSTSNSR